MMYYLKGHEDIFLKNDSWFGKQPKINTGKSYYHSDPTANLSNVMFESAYQILIDER